MTVLSAMQSAAIRLIGRKPSTFFASQEQFEMELVDLVNEVAKDITKSHDWQTLTDFYTLTGDGSTDLFSLPTNYDRMLINSELWDSKNWAWGYTHILSPNEFQKWKLAGWGGVVPGAWIIYGDKFHFAPAPASGAQALFPYIVKEYAKANDETLKVAFDKDDDSFRLDERLITLALIWKWREMKRLDASGDMENFTKAFNEQAGRDKGARILREGPARFPANIGVAYPWVLGA